MDTKSIVAAMAFGGGGTVSEPTYKHNGTFASYSSSSATQIDMGEDLKCNVGAYSYCNNGGYTFLQAKKSSGNNWVSISPGIQTESYRYFKAGFNGNDGGWGMCSVSAVALINQ